MYRKKHRISSFTDLLSRLLGNGADSCYSCGFSVFRGDTNVRHGLVPSVGRNPSVFEREREIYSDYIRFATAYGEDVSYLSRYDRLASAQHNGVPTRLLDWSLNPLVAAYFATQPRVDGANFVAKPNSDAAIYVLHCCERIEPQPDTNPFEVASVQIFHPTDVRSRRIVAQQGVFSVQPNPQEDLGAHLIDLDPEEGLWVDRIEIPEEVVTEVRDSVSYLGMGQRALFPDASGLGQSLRLQSRNGHQFTENE